MRYSNPKSKVLFTEGPNGPVSRVELSAVKSLLKDDEGERCHACCSIARHPGFVDFVEESSGIPMTSMIRKQIRSANSTPLRVVCVGCEESGRPLVTESMWPLREFFARHLCGGTLLDFSDLVFGDDRLVADPEIAYFIETALDYMSQMPPFNLLHPLEFRCREGWFIQDVSESDEDLKLSHRWQATLMVALWRNFLRPDPGNVSAWVIAEKFVSNCNRISAGEPPLSQIMEVNDSGKWFFHVDALDDADGLMFWMRVGRKDRFPLLEVRKKGGFETVDMSKIFN